MAGSRFRSTGAPTTALQSACSCSRWLRTSLLGFYGGWGLAEKSPHSLRVALSWMTPSETLLRLCLGGFGDMKWAWGGGWRLPAFLCQTTSSPGFCPISRAHFRDRKTLRKRVHHKGPPLWVWRRCWVWVWVRSGLQSFGNQQKRSDWIWEFPTSCKVLCFSWVGFLKKGTIVRLLVKRGSVKPKLQTLST